MIATMGDAFRVDLPASILRAQARITKVIVEGEIPVRLLRVCVYLVSITAMTKHGKVHFSRSKLAGVLGVSERTVDRHLDELESHAILSRLTRSRSPGGYFYGTCLRWSSDIWSAVFLEPGRTRTEALRSPGSSARPVLQTKQAMEHGLTGEMNPSNTVEATCSRGEVPEHTTNTISPETTAVKPLVAPSSGESPAGMAQSPSGNHATFLADYSPQVEKVVDKKLFFVNAKQAQPTSNDSMTRAPLKVPLTLLPWMQKLQLVPQQIGMLLAVAKRTDVNKTKTRLQDLLTHVGDRLYSRAVFAEQASKYLYRCLDSGEDYSPARFVNQAPGQDDGKQEIAAANALRKSLPEGKTTTINGQDYVRNGLAVYRCGINSGSGVLPLTRAQMAVVSMRAGLYSKDGM